MSYPPLILVKQGTAMMKIAPFSIEAFFAMYEFTTPYSLCSSDCESMTVGELMAMAEVAPEDLVDLHLGYTEAPGHPALRAQIAALYPEVMADEVVVLTAPEEGIYTVMRTLLEPGDHVVVLTPAYDSLLNLAEHVAGADYVDKWEVEAGNGRWQINLSTLEDQITNDTKLIVVNFPHNPTGYLPTANEFQAIIDMARRHGIWLFCDEMYRGLEGNGADNTLTSGGETKPRLQRSTLPSAATQYERAISLSGLSKTHGLPGLRSGWLIVRDEAIRQQLINWKFYTTICPPAPSEFLAMAALNAHEKLVARSRKIIDDNLQIADSFFARWPGLFDWRPPLAGSVALVGLNVPSATAYCHALAKEAGVLLLPSSCLGYGDQHVRLGFGRLNFGAGLAQFERALQI